MAHVAVAASACEHNTSWKLAWFCSVASACLYPPIRGMPEKRRLTPRIHFSPHHFSLSEKLRKICLFSKICKWTHLKLEANIIPALTNKKMLCVAFHSEVTPTNQPRLARPLPHTEPIQTVQCEFRPTVPRYVSCVATEPPCCHGGNGKRTGESARGKAKCMKFIDMVCVCLTD